MELKLFERWTVLVCTAAFSVDFNIFKADLGVTGLILCNWGV